MNKLLLSLALLPAALSAQSEKQNFDFGWKFIEQEMIDAQSTTLDDSNWQSVNLPHDWDIFHAPEASAPMGNDGGYFPGGIGWYRKTFTAPKKKSGASYQLHFEGVYQKCQVYLNGRLAGTHAYGYTPFHLDITSLLQPGKNVVAVHVDNSQMPNCRWYSGSGIYRHVWLETYLSDAIDDPKKLFISTQQVFGISADGTHADSATVRIAYEGRPDEYRTFREIDLWSPSHPVLYDIHVGSLSVKHGFRTCSFSADKGFLLNNIPTLINGACVHHDDGILGAMAFDAAEIRKVRLMKEAGFNLIRTAHNPTSRAFLDACDSLGMMVIGEAFDGWYDEKKPFDYHTIIDSCYQEDLAAMVLRDRNHPSIICWSIGNEVIERKELRIVQTAKKMKKEIHRYDTTRPITEALCTWDSDWEIFDPHAEVLDIVGYNYMMHKAESDHERCPDRIMWQTESYPRDAFSNWQHTQERPYIIGDIVWTGLDYLGESGIGQFYYEGEPRGEHWKDTHFPFHGAYCGDVDLVGWRKPISHYRDLLWNTPEGASDLYLAVREPDLYYNGTISETSWSVWPTWESWNWKGWEGKPIEVEIYSKAPQVRLYLNDQIIDTKTVNLATEYKARFTLPYQPGTLKAVTLDAQGKEVAESLLHTSGEPAAVRLIPDRRQLHADGEDLAFVRLEVVNKEGNIVPDAAIPLTVQVTGQASLLAAATANLKDLEPKTSPHVTTYKGQALLILRSGQKTGKATITVFSAEWKNVAKIQLIIR